MMTDKIEVPRELLEELRDCANDCFHYESTLSYSRSTRVNFYEGLVEQCGALLRSAAQPEPITPPQPEGFRDIGERIAELEADPAKKAALDRARERMHRPADEELRRDAERYRAWRKAIASRNNAFVEALNEALPDTSFDYILSESEIDAAYDTAIAAENQEHKQ